jgi:hypothetical protein
MCIQPSWAAEYTDSPGDSMLVDTGWPDDNGRDARRILAAARDAGIHSN